MTKYIIGAIFVVLAGAVGFYIWSIMGAVGEAPQDTEPQVQEPIVRTFATSTYALDYPPDFTIDDGYFYDQFEGKPIFGVKFSVPITMATGTNLSADSYLSVEQLPRALSCTGDIYVVPNVRATDVTEGASVYSVATTSGAAAGNQYEEQVWALKGSDPCTAVRYFIHTTQLANYDPGTVREYDRPALLGAFDTIRRSLRLMAPASEDAGLTP